MTLPDFSFEHKLHRRGRKLIAGIDEVGRGCFAGPVVAGCVVFDREMCKLENIPVKINDSKKLSSKWREVADEWIRENAKGVGIGVGSVSQINRLGIKKATEIAFRKAIKNCDVQIDYLLIDAFYIPYVKGLRRRNQKAIIKGDTKSVSIAAASIVAKVYRDKLMTNLSLNRKFKKYQWDKNKGYGTKIHQEMIRKYGTTRLHRKQFVDTWLTGNK
jgi:ribonuclease HII